MNPDLFFDHFDALADLPGGVDRLRQSILQLAVQGKLVKHEPTSEWKSEVMGNLFQFIDYRGKTPVKTESGARLITAKNVRMGYLKEEPFEYVSDKTYNEWMTRGFPQCGDLLFTTEAPLGNVCRVELKEPFALAQRVINLHPKVEVDTHFLMFAIMSPLIQSRILDLATGMTATGIKASKLKDVPLPIPPLAEQRRIVTKVEQLMKLCDELEARQTKRGETREHLRAAALDKLCKAESPAELGTHWKRIEENFDTLFDTPNSVAPLRQSILQLAVQGKLTIQDTKDAPAQEVIDAISKEKTSLEQTGQRVLTSHTHTKRTGLFALPQNWIWTTLQQICLTITDGDHLPPPRTETGIPFLVIGNVSAGEICFDNTRYVSEDYYNSLDWSRQPIKGDILYTVTGSFGIPVAVRSDKKFCVQRHIAILRPPKSINHGYLFWLLKSPVTFEQAKNCATGIAQKTVPLSGLRQIQIPIPPLAEQHRIVAKVDQLMALCDTLETKLKQAQADGERLADAVVHHLLNEPAPAESTAA